jgi:hypothetical protein
MPDKRKDGGFMDSDQMTRYLPVVLDELEIRTKSKELASKNLEKNRADREFANIKKSMAESIKSLQEDIDRLSEIVDTGIEKREVECYERRVDQTLTIQIIRTDTFEVVTTRPMTDTERQLVMFPTNRTVILREYDLDQSGNDGSQVSQEAPVSKDSIPETEKGKDDGVVTELADPPADPPEDTSTGKKSMGVRRKRK